MKAIPIFVLIFSVSLSAISANNPPSFFNIPDSVQEIRFHYKEIQNLIILPVRINGKETVNLILDTGCRNLVLFGKRFSKMIQPDSRKAIFNGLGSGAPVTGFVTLGNSVSFEGITGKQLPIVVVPEKNLFRDLPGIDGVIGYELFFSFEIEIDFPRHAITFRPAQLSGPRPGFETVPISITDSKPIISCKIVFDNATGETCDLLIDTGSALGLIYTTPDKTMVRRWRNVTLGQGFNGNVKGNTDIARHLVMGHFVLHDVKTAIVTSPHHHYASLGTGVLRDYTFVINYYKHYVGFRKERA